MAGKEGQPRTPEQKGALVRNVGLGVLVVGLLGEISLLTALGAGGAIGGEVYRRFNKPTTMKAGKEYSPKS